MQFNPSEAEVADVLIAAGREVGAKGLTWGAAGNISGRLPDGGFLISASGAVLGDLACERLVRCDPDGTPRPGSPRSSVETGLHAAVYHARADVRAILHASPFYATLVASACIPIEPFVTTDTTFYVREVRRVPFCVPGSDELARAVAGHAAGCDALLLDNHGAVTLGATPAAAVTRMEALELLCRLLTYGALGVPLRPLQFDQARAMLIAMGRHGGV